MLRYSRMINLGTPATAFSLPDGHGRIHELADFAGSRALLVAFICNHCPFVLHVIDSFAAMANAYMAQGLATVAIASNDPSEFEEDAPERMPAFAVAHGFQFPYLYDETQETAKAYNAICTPDFFLFDADRLLRYAGQYDGSRPCIDKPTPPGVTPLRTDLPIDGADMRAAIEAVLVGEPVPEPHRASAGCSIKWRPGNDPSWG